MKGLPAGRLLAIYAAFVVYGSLVPLDFTPLPWAQAWTAFKALPLLALGVEARADWVANGVLYLPLGWLAALAGLQRARSTAAACVLAWLGCALVAGSVEFAQLYFPPRTVSQNDLIAEALGSALGVLLAPLSRPWLQRTWTSQTRANLGLRLLQAYAVGYVALCFFPYDVLISAAELRAKADADQWAWTVAGGGVVSVLRLLLEVVLSAPLGVLVARANKRPALAVPVAAAAGGLLGLAIELGQFFIASGVSQGASVGARACGLALGAWLVQRWAAHPWPLRPLLRRLSPLWAPAWLLGVLAANGLLTRSWQDLTAAATAWRELRLLPFYYHYYTTEALALISAGSVFLMYLPLALLGWTRGWRSGVAVACAALLAALVEGAKLLVIDRHPDPTNVLIAVAAVAGGRWLIEAAHRPWSPAAVTPLEAPTLRRRVHPLFVLGLGLGLPGAVLFPAAPWVLTAALVACAALTWRWPVLALGLLPAALPVLDLAPWSGRFFWDEWDLLCAVCIGVAWQRTRGTLPGRQPRWLRAAYAVLALSLVFSSLRALWPWPGVDDNSFNNYHSAFNALRIVKGAVWAALFVATWRRLHGFGAARERAFTRGMVVGLALTVAAVVVERSLFVQLDDFAVDYRVTGLISAMHKGGAFIECWLAVAGAFGVAWALRARDAGPLASAVLLLAGLGYAMVVTYSRAGYAALGAAVAVVLLCTLLAWRRRGRGKLRLVSGALMLTLMIAAAWPALSGSFARERLAASARDLAVRVAHWQDGRQLRGNTLADTLLGIGIGRYPQAHFWRSSEPVRAATYALNSDQQGPYLRLGTGATLYVEQFVDWPPGGALQLSLRLRSASAVGLVPTLRVALCEKWTLTSRGCVGGEVRPVAQSPGTWQQASVRLDPAGLPAPHGRLRAPLKLALLTPAQAAVDVADLRLTSADGEELLLNGNFAQGLDRWFFATDVDPPWQLHSLPVTVLVEQGWLGVLAWTALLVGALASAGRLAWQGRAEVLAAPAALAGFLVCGALNTLVDAPRFLWLLLVLAWLCTRARRPAGQPVPAGAGSRHAA